MRYAVGAPHASIVTRRPFTDWPLWVRSLELGPCGPSLASKRFDEPDDESAFVLLAPLLVGVCRSDVREAAGTRAIRRDFGHEIAARVVEARRVSGLVAGSMAVLDPHIPITRTSGFAELVFATATPEALRQAVPVAPPGLSPERLVFCEPLACALHCVAAVESACERDDLRGLHVAIIGAGMAAVLIAMGLCRLGATVSLLNRSEERLAWLAASGALPTAAMATFEGAPERSADAVVVTTAGVGATELAVAISTVRDGGAIIVYGPITTDLGMPFTPIDVDALRRSEARRYLELDGRTVVFHGSYGATGDDFNQSFKVLLDPEIRFERLIAGYLSLDDLPDFFERAVGGSERLLGKTVVRVASETKV